MFLSKLGFSGVLGFKRCFGEGRSQSIGIGELFLDCEMLMEVDGKLAYFLNFALIILDPCSVWLETRNIPSQHETYYSLMHIFNLFPPSLRHILTTSLGRHITDMVSQRQILNFFILIYPCFDSLVYILIFLFSNNPYYPSLLFHSLPRSFTLSVAPFCTCLIGSVTIL